MGDQLPLTHPSTHSPTHPPTQKEVDGEACQLWDYHEATQSNTFRNKLGYVADVRAHVGPEVGLIIILKVSENFGDILMIFR